jgi:AraC-like DNA-binding protein
MASTEVPANSGTVRIGSIRGLPEVLRKLGVDPAEVFAAVGVPRSVFDDGDERLGYGQFARLVGEAERRSGCEHIGLLVGQSTRLADFGLLARAALCCATAGEALAYFVENFDLHSRATTVTLACDGRYARFAFMICELGIAESRQIQIGSMAVSFNLMRDLFGPHWQPTSVDFACRAASDPRPLQRFFAAPLQFDRAKSELSFDRRWLDRPLPPIDVATRREVDAAVRNAGATRLVALPELLRATLRKQILIGDCSMERVAAQLGVHRRTLDRRLQRHRVRYGDLLKAVKHDIAQRMLRDTELGMQQIAETLHFSSAANFATAFRGWSGMTPTEYRKQAR